MRRGIAIIGSKAIARRREGEIAFALTVVRAKQEGVLKMGEGETGIAPGKGRIEADRLAEEVLARSLSGRLNRYICQSPRW